jgi:hypothetical protein
MALEGNLEDMSMADLIQVFRMGAKTGVLLLVRHTDHGVVYVCGGRLIDAILMHGSEHKVIATDEEAVLRLLLWDDAHFTFRHDTSVEGRTHRIRHDGEWLIMESIRRREQQQQAQHLPTITLDTRLELGPLPSSGDSGVQLSLEQWRILSYVSSHQVVRAICHAMGMDPERLIRMISELVAIGIVDIMPVSHAMQAWQASNHTVTRTHAPAPTTPPSSNLMQPATAAMSSMSLSGRILLQAIKRRVRGL